MMWLDLLMPRACHPIVAPGTEIISMAAAHLVVASTISVR
jgi:hypothetical protein